nr:HAMP domain-containing sensor histidine kinase [Pseudomarimonas arenosa]
MTHLFQRFYLLLLASLLLYLLLGMSIRHGMQGLSFADGTLLLIGVAMLISILAYPLARRISSRLARLSEAVTDFGRGNLQRRAPVEGHDEIADLARGFNEAAARIEENVQLHRALLANASHELRTPLARIRLGVELVVDKADSKRRQDLIRDLHELDDLLEEILLSSRLDSALPLNYETDLDPLALVAEEASRYAELDIRIEGRTGLRLDADRKLMRRLIRNLLENAKRYGAPPVRLGVAADPGRLQLSVEDSGAGIPELDVEHVFQPFFRIGGRQENVGVGLGLALVRQIAERHGGSANCGRSSLGGARILIDLPRHPPRG